MLILKRQAGEAPSTSIYPSHIIIAFLAGLLFGILLSIAAFYLKRSWMNRQRNPNIRKLQIASRSSLVLPQINSPSLLDAVHADVINRRKSIFAIEHEATMETSNMENDMQIIKMEELPSNLGIDYLFNETDAVNTLSETDQKHTSEPLSDQVNNESKNTAEFKDLSNSQDSEQDADNELESKISQTAILKQKLDQTDPGISLSIPKDSKKSIQVTRIHTSVTKSRDSKKSSNNSASSGEDNSPLSLILNLHNVSTKSYSPSRDSRLGILLDEYDSGESNPDTDYDSTFDIARSYSNSSFNSDLADTQSDLDPDAKKSSKSNVLPQINTSQESVKNRSMRSAKSSPLISGESKKSSNLSSISQTDSPLGILLKTEYKN